VRLAFSGVAPRPTLLRLPAGEVERLTAAVAAFQPDGDLNGSPVFRRRLARVLAQQVWQEVGA
jgi:CO/xanthine dehydrogenase FAD-binding subunit